MILPRLRALGLGWLSLAFFVPARAADSATWHVFHHEGVLGTSLELRFAAPQASAAVAAEAAALAEFDRLGKVLSGYDATSEFRQWFATHGEPRPVSPELFEVLALFDSWRERTGGALDASAEVAGRLWKTAVQNQRVPYADELAAAVRSAGQPGTRPQGWPRWRQAPISRRVDRGQG